MKNDERNAILATLPNHELDRLVSQKIMGWKWVT